MQQHIGDVSPVYRDVRAYGGELDSHGMPKHYYAYLLVANLVPGSKTRSVANLLCIAGEAPLKLQCVIEGTPVQALDKMQSAIEFHHGNLTVVKSNDR